MRSRLWLVLPLAAAVACGGGDPGPPSLVAVEGNASASDCPDGGVVLGYGVDANRNGTLDESEIDGTTTVCNGSSGTDGSSCSVLDNGDGTKTISCADGTTATVADGRNGAGCTIVDNGDGTKTITCADGTTVTVSDASAGSLPVCDVRAQGAVGDGTTDDTAAIMSCVALFDTRYAATGGVVYFPPSSGAYCTYTGINDGGGVDGPPIDFVGAGQQVLSSCGHNTPVLHITHGNSVVRNLRIYGYGLSTGDTFGAATAPALWLDTGAVFSLVDNVYAAGGMFPIQVNSFNYRVNDSVFQYGYGDSSGGAIRSAIAYTYNGGGTWEQDYFDQVLPVNGGAGQPAFPATIQPWAAGHAYSQGTVVTVTCASRTWYIQATNDGTSGGSSPTCQNYGQPITDAGVTWLLVAPDPYYGMQVDTGAQEVIVNNTDMTGFFSYSFIMSDTFGGARPYSVYLTNVTPGGAYLGNLDLQYGSVFSMSGGDVQGCSYGGCANVYVSPSFGGRGIVQGVTIWNGGTYSVLLGSGAENMIFVGNVVENGAAFYFSGLNDYMSGYGNDCSSATSGINGSPGPHSSFSSANNTGC